MKQKIVPVQILEQIPEQISSQNQETSVKYSNFIYCLINRNKTVPFSDQVSIDYTKAESEIHSIDWTYKNNGISIFNLRIDDDIFCSRLGKDKWFVLTRVLENNVYTGYQWSSYPDTVLLLNVVREFFEEGAWFEMLNWTKIKWESDFSN